MESGMLDLQHLVGAETREQPGVLRNRGAKSNCNQCAPKSRREFIAAREQFQSAARDVALKIGLAHYPNVATALARAARILNRPALVDARAERAQFFQCGNYFACGTFGILRVDEIALGLRRFDDANLLHPMRGPRAPKLICLR